MAEGRLNGKAAIVTGGATGVGGGIADKLAAEGAAVLIVDIDEAEANARSVTIRDGGGLASAMEGDVSREDVAKAMVDRAVDEYGRLDILVFITGVVLPVDGGLSIQLQENIVFELKNYIQENPGLKTFFDGGFGSGDRR